MLQFGPAARAASAALSDDAAPTWASEGLLSRGDSTVGDAGADRGEPGVPRGQFSCGRSGRATATSAVGGQELDGELLGMRRTRCVPRSAIDSAAVTERRAGRG